MNCLNLILINSLTNDTAIIIGIVPKPKNIIYAQPDIAAPVVTAPNKPIYTNPHGKKPFIIPIVNKDGCESILNSLPQDFFIMFENRLTTGNENSFDDNLPESRTANIIVIPMIIDKID
jgi:hypothetical protein